MKRFKKTTKETNDTAPEERSEYDDPNSSPKRKIAKVPKSLFSTVQDECGAGTSASKGTEENTTYGHGTNTEFEHLPLLPVATTSKACENTIQSQSVGEKLSMPKLYEESDLLGSTSLTNIKSTISPTGIVIL